MSELNTFISTLKEVNGDITKIKEKFTISEDVILNKIITAPFFWEIFDVYETNEDKIKFITEVYNVFNICKKNKYNDKLQPLDPRTNNPIHTSHLKVIDDECFDENAIIEKLVTKETLILEEAIEEKTKNIDAIMEEVLNSPVLNENDKEVLFNEAFYTKIIRKFSQILFVLVGDQKDQFNDLLVSLKKIISDDSKNIFVKIIDMIIEINSYFNVSISYYISRKIIIQIMHNFINCYLFTLYKSYQNKLIFLALFTQVAKWFRKLFSEKDIDRYIKKLSNNKTYVKIYDIINS